jgi:hypothetical protein
MLDEGLVGAPADAQLDAVASGIGFIIEERDSGGV